MKGKNTLDGLPFRYGGIGHDFDRDNEQTAEILGGKLKCWCCGGIMRNHHHSDGSVHRFFPYCGVFKITKGRDKGRYRFRMLCRACAYSYGRGVIEMDGNKYMNLYDFSEKKHKEMINDENADI